LLKTLNTVIVDKFIALPPAGHDPLGGISDGEGGRSEG